MLRIFNTKLLSKITFIFFVFIYSFFSEILQANDINQTNQKISNYANKSNGQNSQIAKSLYLIGAGDILFINFSGVEFYSGAYSVNPEGYIDLPEIGTIDVNKITTKELKLLLEDKYKNIIFNPDITVKIVNYRPVSIYVSGEVKKPGLYRLPYQSISLKNSIRNDDSNTIPSIFKAEEKRTFISPKLFDALQIVDGVTNNANLSEIIIKREFSRFQGGGKIRTSVNLLNLITNGDQTQNIRIMDGDHIVVPKSEKLFKEQLLAIRNSNLNPESIQIYITGNVFKTGPIILKKGSSLIQAIASAGGKKFLTGNIEFIRFNDDGSTQKRKFRFEENAKINTEKNPILMDGDIVNVKRTVLGSATEVIREISNPVIGGYGLYKIFND